VFCAGSTGEIAGRPAPVAKATRAPGGGSIWFKPSVSRVTELMDVRHASMTAIVRPSGRCGNESRMSRRSRIACPSKSRAALDGFCPAESNKFSASTCNPCPEKKNKATASGPAART